MNYTDGTAETKTYYYILNLQGDVVELVEHTQTLLLYRLNTVATYIYNAWGEIVSATGEMAEINPLRYRGYYYDVETGFYYLQSRYYDPAMHRFINADSLASTGQGIIGTNMFAYCNNSPVFLADHRGTLPISRLELGNEMMAKGGYGLFSYVLLPSPPFWPSPEVKEAAVAVNNIRKGVTSIGKGVVAILAPVPTIAEDLIGVGKITYGVIITSYGLVKLIVVLVK